MPEQYDIEFRAQLEDALDKISTLETELNRVRAQLAAVGKETGASENIDKVAVAFDVAEKEGSDFFNEIEKGSTFTQRSAFQFAKAIQAIREELERTGKATPEQVAHLSALEQKFDDLVPKAARAREEQDQLRRSIELAGKGSRDFARDLGLPIDRLALYTLGVAAAKDITNVLREQAVKPLAEEFGLTAEQTNVLEVGLNNIELILRGKVATAFLGARDVAASFFVEMVQGEAALAAVENKVAGRVHAIIEARRQALEAGNQQAEALSKLIAMEEAKGKVEEDTIERAQRLVDQFGNKLPEAFLKTAEAIGVVLPKDKELAEQLERANKALEASVTRTEKLAGAISMTERDLNGLTEELEVSISLLQLQGEVTEEESTRVEDKLRKQLALYREIGVEAPEHLVRLAEKWGVVEDAADKAGKAANVFADEVRDSADALAKRDEELVKGIDLLKEEGTITEEVSETIRHKLEDQLDAYHRIGQEVPPEIQRLAEEFGALSAAQERAIDLAERLEDVYEGNRQAIEDQTEAMRIAIERIEEDGFIHAEVAERMARDLDELIGQYERFGERAPADIVRARDRMVQLSDETINLAHGTDRLGGKIREAFDPEVPEKFRKKVEEVRTEVDDFFDQVQQDIADTFSDEAFGLPPEGTVTTPTAPNAPRPPAPAASAPPPARPSGGGGAGSSMQMGRGGRPSNIPTAPDLGLDPNLVLLPGFQILPARAVAFIPGTARTIMVIPTGGGILFGEAMAVGSVWSGGIMIVEKAPSGTMGMSSSGGGGYRPAIAEEIVFSYAYTSYGFGGGLPGVVTRPGTAPSVSGGTHRGSIKLPNYFSASGYIIGEMFYLVSVGSAVGTPAYDFGGAAAGGGLASQPTASRGGKAFGGGASAGAPSGGWGGGGGVVSGSPFAAGGGGQDVVGAIREQTGALVSAMKRSDGYSLVRNSGGLV